MQLPKPKMLSSAKRQMVTTFYGLDRTDLCGEDVSDGESYFSDMKNGGSDSFPFAASRSGRGIAKLLDNPANGLLGTDKLAYVGGQKLIYDGSEVLTDLIDGEKRLVAFGANILVYPDQKYYNTVTGESGAMETAEAVSGSATYDGFMEKAAEWLTLKGGETIVAVDYSGDSWFSLQKAYNLTTCGICFYEPSGTKSHFKSYLHARVRNGVLEYLYSGTAIWTSGGGGGTQEKFKIDNQVWKTLPVSAITTTATADGYLWNGDFPIAIAEGKLLLGEPGRLDTVFSKMETDGHTLTCTYNWTKSNLPRLDHVCVLDNRLWGCRYGMQAGSTAAVNEIYCSALGDFKKWDTFQGISTDPWYAGVAEAGPFTGAVAYGGHPIFFKEDCAYVISGSYPPYSVTTLHIAGVAQGASRSICEVDGALYYKSRYAVMRYTSSSIGSVSDRLGRLPDAVRACAGSYNGKYYLSLAGEIYVYDTKRGMWCAEDACGAVDFATADGKLYIAGGHGDTDGKYPICVAAPGMAAEADMPWSFTTPRIGYGLPNRKYVSRVLIRLEIGDAALPTVELSRDGGAWEVLSCAARVGADGARTGSITIPIRPRRCESFRIRVSGVGAYKLTGITKYMEESGR